jgi:hypothetical protein
MPSLFKGFWAGLYQEQKSGALCRYRLPILASAGANIVAAAIVAATSKRASANEQGG